MKKENLNDFLKAIESFGALWGPVRNGEEYALERVNDYSKLDLTALRTKIPFKKLLFPPRFSMFTFTGENISPALENLPHQVIFGLHPCDIHGLRIMALARINNLGDRMKGQAGKLYKKYWNERWLKNPVFNNLAQAIEIV